MNILIADDDPISRTLLAGILTGWGYEVVPVADGTEAWRALQAEDAPKLAILDWMMPGLTGKELCQMVRGRQTERYTYLLLVSARAGQDDIIEGLETGADDYLIKPYNPPELRARLIAGQRVLDLQERLFAAQEDLRREAGDPRQALSDRKTVERARGILMKRANLDEQEAFRRLQKLASEKNRKLVEIATMILTAEEALQGP